MAGTTRQMLHLTVTTVVKWNITWHLAGNGKEKQKLFAMTR